MPTLHWTCSTEPSGRRHPVDSWQCHLEHGPLRVFQTGHVNFVLSLLFCSPVMPIPLHNQPQNYLFFKILSHTSSSNKPFLVASVPWHWPPLAFPLDFHGAPWKCILGCVLCTIQFYYQFHVLRTHLLICAINSSSQCGHSGLVLRSLWYHLKIHISWLQSEVRFALSPAAGGRVVNWYNLLGESL